MVGTIDGWQRFERGGRRHPHLRCSGPDNQGGHHLLQKRHLRVGGIVWLTFRPWCGGFNKISEFNGRDWPEADPVPGLKPRWAWPRTDQRPRATTDQLPAARPIGGVNAGLPSGQAHGTRWYFCPGTLPSFNCQRFGSIPQKSKTRLKTNLVHQVIRRRMKGNEVFFTQWHMALCQIIIRTDLKPSQYIESAC